MNTKEYLEEVGIKDIRSIKSINKQDEERIYYDTELYELSKVDVEKGIIYMKRKEVTFYEY